MFGRGMTLADFKFIYWMEYGHRMWGRALGVIFAVPAMYFASRGWLRGRLARRLAVLFLMGGTQGLVGWWMVRSGLEVLGPAAMCRDPARLAGICCDIITFLRRNEHT